MPTDAATAPGSTRPPRGSTPTRLLDAAERLFAARGYANTSVRDITHEAACNIAGINYHFGGKDQLYREVYARRLAALREARLAVLREVVAREGGLPSLEAVLGAFAASFLSPLSSRGEGRTLVDLMVRELAEPHLPRRMFQQLYAEPVQRALADAMVATTPGLGADEARASATSFVAQLVHQVHAARRNGASPCHPTCAEALARHIRHIVRFSAAGVRACALRGTLP